MKHLEKESFDIQARVRRGIEVERENENMNKSVEAQREKERELARQVEELRGTIRHKDMDIERLQGKHENVNYYQKSLEADLSALRNEN